MYALKFKLSNITIKKPHLNIFMCCILTEMLLGHAA